MSSSPKPPAAPEQQSALLPIMMNLLVNRQNSSSPYGGQEYGRIGEDGQFQAFNPSDPSVIAAISQAFADPSNPDIASFLSIMPNSARTYESPRVEAMRTRAEDQDNTRRAIASQYLAQMGVSANPLPGSEEAAALGMGGNVPMLPGFAQKQPLDLQMYSEFFRRRPEGA